MPRVTQLVSSGWKQELLCVRAAVEFHRILEKVLAAPKRRSFMLSLPNTAMEVHLCL